MMLMTKLGLKLFVAAALSALLVNAGCRPSHELRVLYWNIQNGMWDGQGDNYGRFAGWVKEQDPDICVWCESISLYKDNTAEPLQEEERYLPQGWKELAARYGHQYIYMGGHRDDYPQVITSRFPINDVKRIVGNGKDTIVSHGAGWATIDFAGKRLNIVTLHTWPQRWGFNVPAGDRERSKAAHEGDRQRLMEMEHICGATICGSRDAGNEYWMMMGDFNAKSATDNWFYKWPEDTAAFLVHNYIKEATPYIDAVARKHPDEFLTTTGGKTRIDFFYCTEPLYEKIVRADVVSDEYTTPVRNAEKISNFWHPSDHRPIIVDFKF